MIKIAQLSCGTEYSAVQAEIENAAEIVGAKMVYPDVDMNKIDKAVDEFGFNPNSPQLKLMIARAIELANKNYAKINSPESWRLLKVRWRPQRR